MRKTVCPVLRSTGLRFRAAMIRNEIGRFDRVADGLKTLQNEIALRQPPLGTIPSQRLREICGQFDRQLFLG